MRSRKRKGCIGVFWPAYARSGLSEGPAKWGCIERERAIIRTSRCKQVIKMDSDISRRLHLTIIKLALCRRRLALTHLLVKLGLATRHLGPLAHIAALRSGPSTSMRQCVLSALRCGAMARRLLDHESEGGALWASAVESEWGALLDAQFLVFNCPLDTQAAFKTPPGALAVICLRNSQPAHFAALVCGLGAVLA